MSMVSADQLLFVHQKETLRRVIYLFAGNSKFKALRQLEQEQHRQ